jgi:2-polyprenyl-6-hydroxyphenyl methylase/3-demethylubiquinone-9 3-methyltransferase
MTRIHGAQSVKNDFYREIAAGDRFRFGENWSRFLSVLNEGRIVQAENGLRTALGVSRLDGKTFLDVGFGSGIHSLAARRLGATVRSFDFDPQSVACTTELRDRFFPGDDGWIVESGSVLDASYLSRLAAFDVVYSWGVLHHTDGSGRCDESLDGSGSARRARAAASLFGTGRPA